MSLSPAMIALAQRTAAAWRAEQDATSDPDCPRCGSDEHAYCAPECAYCAKPAVHESAIGLHWDVMEPPPAKEHRCDECQADFERIERKQRRLAAEGWI